MHIHTMVCALLRHNGYTTASAYSGTEALLLLSQNDFAVVLLDLMLPGKTGEEVLQAVRATQNIPIISRAVEGDLVLQPVNIGQVLRDTLAGSFAEIETGGFVVETVIPDAPVYCRCDEEALRRILQNLISNAVAHGKDRLCVTLSDDTITIANKTDHIAQIDAQGIFDRFYTADTSRSNKRTGLGLAIAKELAEKMGGRIEAGKVEDMLVISLCLLTVGMNRV